MPHVFLSYSRKDTTFVEQLERDLNTRGIATWRDTSSIVGGEEWYQAIMRGIHDSFAMLQVVTPASEVSKWVRREGLYADQRDLPIIPVLPEPHPIPFHLIETQPVLCENYAEGFARLIAALKQLQADAPVAATADVADPRELELAYLDFLLGELQADLKSAYYVNLLAEQQRAERATPTAPQSVFGGGFEITFDRLVDLEHLHSEQLDQPGQLIDDARVPLRAQGRVILLGEPGAGKTTTLQQLAIDMAREAKADPDAPLPVFVPLRSYLGREPFEDFVRGWLFTLQSQYARLLSGGRLVLLLDALNEMQRRANDRDLIAEVRGYLRDKQPWIVSCRVRDYQEELKDLPDVGKVRLKPLDLPRIKQVIDRRFSTDGTKTAALWHEMHGSDQLLAAWQSFEGQDKTDDFWKFQKPDDVELGYSWRDNTPHYAWNAMHQDKRRMMLLCRNPFMLFMVCGTFEQIGQLPPNRGALFANFVDNLLKREEVNSRATRRAWIDTAIIRRALASLAYEMQRSETGTEITREQADTTLQALDDEFDVSLLLRLAAAASLLDVGETVRFTHQLLQEYFASEIMGGVMDAERSPTAFWPAVNWWEPQGWEETAIILAGVRGDPERVARWIAPAQPEVAYQALTECGIEADLAQIAPETRTALVSSAQDKTGEANAVGRAAAYRVLGRFNMDDRSGLETANGMPVFEWCEVPAGPFKMGGDPDAYDAWDGADFDLPYTFWIARYPVTYAQYEPFVTAGGYQEQRFWTEAGWQRREQENWTEPRYWNDAQWHLANHPVVGVSWYEVYAYTQWLNEQMRTRPDGAPENHVLRLLRECEWEKAARYPDGRLWPWGNEWENGQYVNWRESGIGRTSAVGIFPRGANEAHGACDLIGNVWEWCLTAWQDRYKSPEAENNDPTGEARRVARGGWWFDYVDYLRAAARSRVYPGSRYFFRGFRVCVSVPI